MKFFFSIIISLLLGWFLNILFTKDEVKKEIAKNTSSAPMEYWEYNKVSPSIEEKIVIKEVIKLVPQIKFIYKDHKKSREINSSEKDLFFIALEKNNFYEALNYYEEAEEEKQLLYQTSLFAYFQKLKIEAPSKAIEQMQYFIEIEPESKRIVFQLAQLFEEKEVYQEALDLIINFSYITSYSDKTALYSKIREISVNYIQKLSSTNSFEALIGFLIDRINMGILTDFYSFELAKVYLKVKKYLNAQEELQTIQENETYKERVFIMLTFIQNKLEEKEEYPIQIPLIRDGLHFLVQVRVDNIPLILLIDTGASITSIDYNKINHLKVIKKDAKFQTANGEITETIFQAKTFSLGSISFKNFKISSLHFTGGEQDGLLGMNFLGKFKFKIDQKEAILFLGNK